MTTRNLAVAAVTMVMLSAAMIPIFHDTGSDADEIAEIRYLEEYGVVEITLKHILPPVKFGAIVDKGGERYWESPMVTQGEQKKVVYLGGPQFKDMPPGDYSVYMYPQSGDYESIVGTFIVDGKSDDFLETYGLWVVIALVAISAIACIVWYVHRNPVGRDGM